MGSFSAAGGQAREQAQRVAAEVGALGPEALKRPRERDDAPPARGALPRFRSSASSGNPRMEARSELRLEGPGLGFGAEPEGGLQEAWAAAAVAVRAHERIQREFDAFRVAVGAPRFGAGLGAEDRVDEGPARPRADVAGPDQTP